MRAFRAMPWAAGLLAALTACGRVGYDSVVLEVGSHDGAARDTAADGPPDVAPETTRDVAAEASAEMSADAEVTADAAAEVIPDVRPPDVQDAFVFMDTSAPPDVMEARPPDAAVDAPTSRTVVATGQNATPRRGGTGGAGVIDTCPAGALLIGFEGTQSTSNSAPAIQSMAGVCATVTLPIGGAPATPWQLTRLPARGNTSGEAWVRLCPDRHVLVGFDGNARNVIGQLVFRCSPIALNGAGTAVIVGSETELDDVGGPALDDFAQVDCPNGQAARGADIRAGSVLEAFGLICATLTLR